MRSLWMACSSCLYPSCTLTSSGWERTEWGRDGYRKERERREETAGIKSSQRGDLMQGNVRGRGKEQYKNEWMRERLTEKLSNLEGKCCPEETSDCVLMPAAGQEQTTGLIMACLALIDRWLKLCCNKSHGCYSPSLNLSHVTPHSVFHPDCKFKCFQTWVQNILHISVLVWISTMC